MLICAESWPTLVEGRDQFLSTNTGSFRFNILCSAFSSAPSKTRFDIYPEGGVMREPEKTNGIF